MGHSLMGLRHSYDAKFKLWWSGKQRSITMPVLQVALLVCQKTMFVTGFVQNKLTNVKTRKSFKEFGTKQGNFM